MVRLWILGQLWHVLGNSCYTVEMSFHLLYPHFNLVQVFALDHSGSFLMSEVYQYLLQFMFQIQIYLLSFLALDHSGSGEYSTKATYEIFFMWLVAQNKCWMADHLARHGFQHPTRCPLCDQEYDLLYVCLAMVQIVCSLLAYKAYLPSRVIFHFWNGGRDSILRFMVFSPLHVLLDKHTQLS